MAAQPLHRTLSAAPSTLADPDVLIVGAGLSGIGAAVHLRRAFPEKRIALIEARGAIGGTWDLFRYPGVRSDSDMYTLGYAFNPWRNPRGIADAADILEYIRETASRFDVERLIHFHHRAVSAEWTSARARWDVEVETPDGVTTVGCRFLYLCTGYYDYEQGYSPRWPGMERFAGLLVHPQHWPAGLDHRGKRVVVIGSGATAVTLVPALARDAAHVVMLQRTPSYIVNRPSVDPLANWMQRRLPADVAYGVTRWKNILLNAGFYTLARRLPRLARRLIRLGVRRQIGDRVDVDTHFAPPYNPWDQRLCLVPDADLFDALRSGRASIVTATIDTFTEDGIRLSNGHELRADIVVSATGLQLRLLGGMRLRVDGQPVDLSRTLAYKGMMFSDVPNLSCAFGYTNASWTLKCDLTAAYVCRLLRFMDAHGHVACVPRRKDPGIREEPVLDFTSGYVQRALHMLPRQGSRAPWRLRQNYLLDTLELKYRGVEDGAMEFRGM